MDHSNNKHDSHQNTEGSGFKIIEMCYQTYQYLGHGLSAFKAQDYSQ